MATYHTEHSFQPGASPLVWNPRTRKSETRPNPNFCAVCCRKRDHVLHPVPNSITRHELKDGTVVVHEYDELGRLVVATRE